jgi:malate permease and related proteins
MDAAFALILASLGAGYAFARLRVLPDDAADTLNRFVIYVCLPAVVLRLVPKLSWQPGLAVLVVTPWVLLGVAVALVLALSRVLGFPRAVKGALLLCVPLGNTSFLGFPMIGALLGPDAVRYAVLYDQLGSFFILATYGLFVVSRFSGEAEPTARSVIARVLRFPPFIALLVALVPFPHPAALDAVLGRFGDTLVPLAMFAVGLKLELRPPKDFVALGVGLGAKMVLFPLLAFALARALGAPHVPSRVAVLESGMPPMITAGALAIMAGLAPELSAALVGYGIPLALVTLPLLARLFP